MSLPRYPAYKDSGVEWLGEVPAHWIVAALNYRYEVLLGKMLDEKRITGEHLAPYLRNVDVQWDRVNVDDLPQMDFSGDDLERYRLRVGDLLVCEGGEVGRAAIWSGQLGECFYQKALHRLRARRADSDVPRYQMYLLRAAADLGIFLAGEGKSTIAHLTAEALRRYGFAYPAPDEQMAITAFLDRETATIDALIAEQERLIELLKEKRQAVISHAVTKGLDPDVPMKDSGVEWLGEVPAHWSTTRLKYAAGLIVDCPHETPTYANDGPFLVIRTSDIEEGVLDDSAMYRVSESEYMNRVRRARLEGNDIVYSREGERWGHAAIVPEGDRFCLGQRMMQFRACEQVDPLYLMWQLTSEQTYRQGQVDTVGATSPHVNVSTIRNFVLAAPPIEEQRLIAKHLGMATAGLDLLMRETGKVTGCLAERRAALISAAVTGQIDVRGQGDVFRMDTESA